MWKIRAVYRTEPPVAAQFPGHGCMDDLTTERSFDSQATWAIEVLGLSFDISSMGVYNQALADVRSTDAGIICLYCTGFIQGLSDHTLKASTEEPRL